MRQVANNITLKRHITGVDTTLCNAVFAAAASHFVDPVERLASAETSGWCFAALSVQAADQAPAKTAPRARRQGRN